MLEDSKILMKKIKKTGELETSYDVGGINGKGEMTCIDLYPGIQIIYNNFHSFDSPKGMTIKNRYIEINHCLRGKFECQYNKFYYAYLNEGDLAVTSWSLEKNSCAFPLGYYKGMELLIDINAAFPNDLFDYFHIHLKDLADKLLKNRDIYILRATKQIQHICQEMYEIEKTMEIDYLRIKVLELLLFLSHIDFSITEEQRLYYPKNQIEKVKAVKEYLTQHLSDRCDIETLSKEFHINIHSLRKVFKEIYGKPLYQWFKEYRLEASLDLLLNTEFSIIRIANEVGYSNPSKYSSAFFMHMGMTPQQYRKSHIKSD